MFPLKSYINYIPREELKNQMNQLASNAVPFLFVVDYQMNGGYVLTHDQLDDSLVKFQFGRFKKKYFKKTKREFNWNITPVPKEKYAAKFRFVQDQLHIGNSFLVNLTQPTEVVCNLGLEELYECSEAPYKLWIKDQFLVMSPESFVKIRGREISSFPMKGTIDARLENAEERILADIKEKAEHATIVDLIRNDLSQIATNVEVKRYRYIDRINTNQKDLLQVSSEITGVLPDNFKHNLGDLIFKLLPAGSITGAPKPRTMEIIAKAEGYDRGFYTGICGYFDGENLDSAVMIRFIEQTENGLVFKSGGGITYLSEADSEYEELIQKIYVPIS